MTMPDQTTISNRLLSLLPPKDFELIAPHLVHEELPKGYSLGDAGEPIETVYFLTSGVGSVVIETPEGHRAEAGLFGFDGYVPTAAITGQEMNMHHASIQIEGGAYSMEYATFRNFMQENNNFAKLMIRAIEAFAVQLTYTAVSNAVHDVNERLARWILMYHDRVPTNEIPLTHEFISLMLAVRRPSVTTSLHILEGNGFIRARRGMITVRNRAALEDFARDAYGGPEREYERLFQNLF